MTIKATVDTSSAFAGLDRLTGEFRVSLARSMGVAGGEVIRDEAKVRAPVGTAEGGSIYPGALRNAIYLAYRAERSLGNQQEYAVSWNSKKAPHGHLIEFGHWQTNAAFIGTDGEWYSGKKLANPKWVSAIPFLRPAYESAANRALAAMMERGAERFPELLAEAGVF